MGWPECAGFCELSSALDLSCFSPRRHTCQFGSNEDAWDVLLGDISVDFICGLYEEEAKLGTVLIKWTGVLQFEQELAQGLSYSR